MVALSFTPGSLAGRRAGPENRKEQGSPGEEVTEPGNECCFPWQPGVCGFPEAELQLGGGEGGSPEPPAVYFSSKRQTGLLPVCSRLQQQGQRDVRPKQWLTVSQHEGILGCLDVHPPGVRAASGAEPSASFA